MQTNGVSMRRLARVLLAATCAVLTAAILSVLLSRFEALAQVQTGSLAASKSVCPSWGRPGERLTYTVRITNTGGPVPTAWMTDELPSEVSYVSGSASTGSLGEAGGVVTWTGSVEPSEVVDEPATAVITFSAMISQELKENVTLSNTAEITGAGTLVRAQASASAIYRFYVYLPVISRRWPPVPRAPSLQEIENPDESGEYVVRWSYDYDDPPVITYTVQDATDADFTNPSEYYPGGNTSLAFADRDDGTHYYYRVRGHNDYGPGEWSNSVSVFTVYSDYFSDSGSGWPDDRGPMKDTLGDTRGYWHRGYKDGSYRFSIENAGGWTWDWFYQPDALAPYRPPSDKYCVETKAKFEVHGWGANAGLVFGADDANSDIYALCLSSLGKDLDWFVVRNDEYDFPKIGCGDMGGRVVDGNFEGTEWDKWNRLQVGVDGNKIRVYVGGIDMGQWTMDNLSGHTRVGLIGGDYEITPVDIRFSYFKVIPNSSCAP